MDVVDTRGGGRTSALRAFNWCCRRMLQPCGWSSLSRPATALVPLRESGASANHAKADIDIAAGHGKAEVLLLQAWVWKDNVYNVLTYVKHKTRCFI